MVIDVEDNIVRFVLFLRIIFEYVVVFKNN